jgi:phosphopantothenoylcysteine decarboxylase/phosphopantothenate--cysteine ligase
VPAGRTVLLGACGGIALYKVPLLISRLRELGADVQVVMTEAATKFVSPLTFQTVSGNPVHTDLFAPPERWNVEHVALAERADLAVVAPATANIIGQAAGGLADDFLSTTLLALTCPVLFVPAMNVNMYGHPAVKRNIETLRGFGHEVMEPDTGRLASGSVGAGRYPETERILAACLRLLGPGDFRGVKVVVTAGPTREPFDPVRFVSNPSTGRMGYALAAEARERGAEVVLVSGPSELPAPHEVRLVKVTTTAEMREALAGETESAGVVVMAAAPADFAPARAAGRKLKKGELDLNVVFALTPDIIREVGERKRAAGSNRPILVGFAAETHDLLASARAKLAAKNLDLIVANPVAGDAAAGFGAETNRIAILGRDGEAEELPLLSKREAARAVFDRVARLLDQTDGPRTEGGGRCGRA